MFNLTFSGQQLEFMANVQSLEDWHCESFIEVIQEHHVKTPVLDDSQFEDMVSKLRSFSLNKISDLQLALDLLSTI